MKDTPSAPSAVDHPVRDILDGRAVIEDWEKAAVGELRPTEPATDGRIAGRKRAPLCRECGARHWGPAHPLPWGKIQEKLRAGESEESRSVSDVMLRERIADGSLTEGVEAEFSDGGFASAGPAPSEAAALKDAALGLGVDEPPVEDEPTGEAVTPTAAASTGDDRSKWHRADGSFDKAAYQREYMRERRRVAREAKTKATWGEGLAGKP